VIRTHKYRLVCSNWNNSILCLFFENGLNLSLDKVGLKLENLPLDKVGLKFVNLLLNKVGLNVHSLNRSNSSNKPSFTGIQAV